MFDPKAIMLQRLPIVRQVVDSSQWKLASKANENGLFRFARFRCYGGEISRELSALLWNANFLLALPRVV